MYSDVFFKVYNNPRHRVVRYCPEEMRKSP